MTAEVTLSRIRDRLDAGADPVALIEELRPQTTADATTWVRRLPVWEEYPFHARVTAVARIVSRRAMKEHGLSLTADGRVTARPSPRGNWAGSPKPDAVFTHMDGQARVEYVRDYFPATGTDHFQFRSPHDPVRPMPLSGSGWWSHFAHRDAVEACGGPEAYATRLAAAKVEGREEEFVAAFEGRWPGERRRGKKPGRPVLGEYTREAVAGWIDEPTEKPSPPGSLF